MTHKRSRQRHTHTALNATMLLLSLARHACSAEPTAAPQAVGKVVEGKVSTARDQLRRQVFGLAGSGSAQLSLEKARANPDAFSAQDLQQLEVLSIDAQVRWGAQQAAASDDPDRLAQTQAALQDIDSFLASLGTGGDQADEGVRRSVLASRVEALRGLGRMNEAAAQYRALASGSDPLPARTHAAAGDAYTYLNDPARAARAYQLALTTPNAPLTPNPEPHALKRIDVEEGLFFAYLDEGHYEDAQKLLASIKAGTPVYADLTGNTGGVSDEFGRVKKLEAQYLLYTDHVREGTAALDELHRDAPFDPSLMNARADAALVLERPYEAKTRYEGTLVDHPGDIETLAGLGKTELELNRYDRAAAINAALGDRFPDSNTVKTFERAYEDYRSAQLIVAANGEKGNQVLADNDWGVDTQLYSMPIASYWRVFAHQFSGRANTGDSNSVSRVRNGIGGDFRFYGLDAAAEVDHSTGPTGYTGATGSVAYAPNDHWRFSTGIDTNANSLPWKAYQAGVTGRAASASVRYSFDAYRYLDLGYGASRYSDTNLHQQWNATWYERLINTPRHELSVWIDLDTNSNTLANTAYFNPHRDMTAQLTTMYQWTPWRNVDKSFSQRAYVTVGGYRQTDIGNSLLWEARLEQQWQFSAHASLAYGIGIASQRFDRTRETTKLVYLNLNVPL